MPTLPTLRTHVLDLTDDPRFAGLAVEAFLAGDKSPPLVGYLDRLPTGLSLAIVHARETHRWAPCSVCGEGILIRAHVGSRGGLTPAKIDDGPRCRISWTTETIGTLTTVVRCPGHHFPLDEPWGQWHPMSPTRGVTPGVAPW